MTGSPFPQSTVSSHGRVIQIWLISKLLQLPLLSDHSFYFITKPLFWNWAVSDHFPKTIALKRVFRHDLFLKFVFNSFFYLSGHWLSPSCSWYQASLSSARTAKFGLNSTFCWRSSGSSPSVLTVKSCSWSTEGYWVLTRSRRTDLRTGVNTGLPNVALNLRNKSW